MFTEPCDKLVPAMLAAFSEMPLLTTNQFNKMTHTHYADTAHVLAQVRPVLAKHKLFITFLTYPHEGVTYLSLVLMHESGQSISSQIVVQPSPPDKARSPEQMFGSTVSYLERQLLAAMLATAVAGEGESPDKEARKPEPRRDPPQKPPEGKPQRTPEELAAAFKKRVGELGEQLSAAAPGKTAELAEAMGLASLVDAPPARYKEVVVALESSLNTALNEAAAAAV